MINSINEESFTANFQSVQIKCFSGATIDEIYFHLILVLKKKTTPSNLREGTNNSPNETGFQIYDKPLNPVHFIKDNNPNFYIALFSSIDTFDVRKAALAIKRFNTLLLYSSVPILLLLIIAILNVVFFVCMNFF